MSCLSLDVVALVATVVVAVVSCGSGCNDFVVKAPSSLPLMLLILMMMSASSSSREVMTGSAAVVVLLP